MSEPRVSVVLSVFNGERYLSKCIESVLNQTLEDFQLLVIDDASTDKSISMIESFRDQRIRFMKNNKNQGLFSNLNTLIRMANAPLIKPWAQDDIMTSDCLEEGWEFYQNHSNLGCFYANCDYIDENDVIVQKPGSDSTPIVLSKEEADRYALMHGCLSSNISNLFFPKLVFDLAGYFREDMIAADFEIMVRIQEKYEIGRIPNILLHLRRHEKQWSLHPKSFIRSINEELRIYQCLKHRVLNVHRSLDQKKIEQILYRKYAVNYFHGAVKYLLSGRIKDAGSVFKTLSKTEPLFMLAFLWFADLPRRLKRSKQLKLIFPRSKEAA